MRSGWCGYVVCMHEMLKKNYVITGYGCEGFWINRRIAMKVGNTVTVAWTLVFDFV
ncbi:hypothetical protein HanLR1_Chr01g0017061 [Helianthus annuus]|nr:hypothetical protein HanHA89_Chr01g0018141 [Helianthus annuus]KAJ0783148.1 hypothetical protein HanLR1_Chr01g0017061 [Helianthus annuus]